MTSYSKRTRELLKKNNAKLQRTSEERETLYQNFMKDAKHYSKSQTNQTKKINKSPKTKDLFIFIRPEKITNLEGEGERQREGEGEGQRLSSQIINKNLLNNKHSILMKFARSVKTEDSTTFEELLSTVNNLDIKAFGSMVKSYIIKRMNSEMNNVVVLYTYDTARNIQIESIFTYTLHQELSPQPKKIVHIQTFMVNTFLPVETRNVSGGNVFQWFYSNVKISGFDCVKIEAISDAMKFWNKSQFAFVLDEKSKYLKHKTDKITERIINNIHIYRDKMAKRHGGITFKQDILRYKDLQLLKEGLDNLYYRTDEAEMVRANSGEKSEDYSFKTANQGSEGKEDNTIFVKTPTVIYKLFDVIFAKPETILRSKSASLNKTRKNNTKTKTKINSI